MCTYMLVLVFVHMSLAQYKLLIDKDDTGYNCPSKHIFVYI